MLTGPGADAQVHEVPDTSTLLLRSEEARTRGDYREGRRLAEEAVALATDARDDRSLAEALRLVCNQALRLGDLEDSARAGSDAVLVAERLGDRPGQVDALNLLSFAYLNLALFEEALEAIERSIERVAAVADPELRSGTFNRAGTIRSAMGDFDEAADLFDRAAAELGSGDVSSETRFCLLTNTADLVLQMAYAGQDVPAGELRRGVELAREALTLAEEAGNPYRQALSLLNAGSLSTYLDDLDVAHPTLRASMELSRTHGYRSLELGVLDAFAMDAFRRKDFAEALDRFGEVVRLAEELTDATVLVRAHQLSSRCHEELGRFREALDSYRCFHELETRQRTQTAQVRARLLGQTFEIQRLRSQAVALGRQAHEDPLTGLDNRRSFDATLPDLLAGLGERDWVCVCLLDVDHFKRVNDTFGHAVGDRVLRRLAEVMREEVRRRDVLARIGGEEFALVCVLPAPERVDHLADGLQQRLDRLRRTVSQTSWADIAPDLRVTLSIGGVLTRSTDAPPAEDLLRQADRLLYAAKDAGRDRVLTRSLSVP
ncbi:GGDEF domain-containing protein [Kineococcus rhizosphaerae]|uniref:Diguanylate cyclase (GGDEF)-like protein n=1 Tax=Kineococcus rhizosphaerae TaxID=559628 RepID=A0A2T0QZM5_9ACTN|nr:GGDEF domain-containing protein [Kineococcus rhizosphaerae]PRY12132.1 diguanylate cyclase (GGDEF)-like protein [Kineococcus rhizosphaerae]